MTSLALDLLADPSWPSWDLADLATALEESLDLLGLAWHDGDDPGRDVIDIQADRSGDRLALYPMRHTGHGYEQQLGTWVPRAAVRAVVQAVEALYGDATTEEALEAIWQAVKAAEGKDEGLRRAAERRRAREGRPVRVRVEYVDDRTLLVGTVDVEAASWTAVGEAALYEVESKLDHCDFWILGMETLGSVVD